YTECHGEVQQAAAYIHQQISSAWPDLFAYPWGQSSNYLRETYFPDFQDQHRTRAAFAASGGYVTRTSPQWNLPRFVSSSQLVGWQDTEGLIRILRGEWDG
ncbi:MAG: polysaccharide deacetylase family protein, partial [Candidatus Binatia bacterium]